MARMARSQTNITTQNGGMAAVKPQSFNHVVPQIASSMTGVNPFAGDLTNAFNQFFGSVQESMSTIQAAEFQQKKIEAQDYAKEMQAAGVNQAREDFQANPSMNQAGLQTSVESMELANENRHFLESYRQTLGASVGDRMYGDFALHMSQRPASSFESEAATWWQNNYGSGTGDEIVDQAMSAAWSRNYETARVRAAGDAIAQSKQAAHDGLVNDVFRRMGAPDWNWNDYASVNRSMASLFPNETNGQVSSRTLGIMLQAAVAQGENATRSFMSFLDQQPMGENGQPGQSIAQRFPAAVARMRDQAYDSLMSYTTLSGQQAFQDQSAELSRIMSMPDEYDQFEALTNFSLNTIPTLQNTAGVPFSQIGALRSQVNERLAELRTYSTNMAGLRQGTSGGSFPAWMGVEDAEQYTSEFILREHDFLNGNGDSLVSTKAGMALQQIYNRFGEGVIGDDMRQMFAGGLLSANPDTVARTVTTLKTMDPTGAIANNILSNNARALGIFNAANVAPTPDGDPVQAAIRAASPEVQASLTQINETGLHNILGGAGLISGDNNSELEVALNNELLGDGLREVLQETLGEDNFWQWDSWGSPRTTPQVDALIRNSYTQAVAQLRADPNQEFTLESIRGKVAQMIQGSLWYDQGVLRLRSGALQAEERTADGFQVVPLANGVHNPDTGEIENTAATLREDIDAITSGLTGINLDTDDIGVRQATHLDQYNGFQLVDENTDLPLVLMVGEPMEIEKQFERGEDGQLSRLGWFSSFIENWSDQTITFTGDPDHDQPLAEMVFGPGVHLREHTASGNPDDPVVGYSLFVAPRFKGTSQYTIADIERMADQQIDPAIAFQAIQRLPVEQRAFAMAQYYARRNGFDPLENSLGIGGDDVSEEDMEAIRNYLETRGINTY
jgi:hypothetical protein